MQKIVFCEYEVNSNYINITHGYKPLLYRTNLFKQKKK